MINLLITIVVILCNVALGSIVLFRNKARALNVYFFLLAFSVAFWTLTNYVSNLVTTDSGAIFWGKLTYVFAILISFFFYLFTFALINKKRGAFEKILVSVIQVASIFLIFTTNFIIGSDVRFEGSVIYLSYGPYFFLYFFVFAGFLLYSLVYLFINYKNSKGQKRLQYKFLFLSTLIAAALGSALNLFLPYISGLGDLTHFGPLATIILVGGIAYAIVKHRLLDIRLVILRTITYSILVILVSAIVVVLVILFPSLVGDRFYQSIIAIFVSVFIVVILDPLKKFLGNITDRFLYKAGIEYAELQRELAEVVNKEIDLKKLVIAVDDKLVKGLKVQKARILLPDASGMKYETLLKNPDKLELKTDSSLIQYLKQDNKITVLESLERKIEDTQDETERKKLEESKSELDRLDVAIAAPVTTDNKLAAILILGIKKSGDTFSQDDLNLLEVLGPQLASAIEKSKLYDQIRRFNVKLQKEIAIATEGLRKANEDLQDRNRFLTSLQAVTQLITKSLDFKTVTQAIVDSIATQMGFIGGVLLFYGEDKNKLFPEAITRVKYTTQVAKLLPKPIEEYHADVKKDDTKAVQAVLTGEIQRGEHFAEFVSPPVPTIVATGIQKLVHGHSFLGVPIRSDNEVVGCIVFLFEESLEEVNQNDINMMTSLADQTGIIYRNLELVQKLRRTNDELEEANERLKQLDKAKSEFVSIASHQLRTPMTGIMGYLSMMTSGDFGKIPKQQQGILEQLLDASQKMIQLINLFLDVSKIESGKLVLSRGPHKIEEIIDRSIQVIGKIASDKGLKLEFVHPKKELPMLQIDDKIFDVVSNLIDNAIKYTEKGSITVTAVKEDDNIKVTVKDTGRGIPPEEAKNLFNKFVRGYGIAQVNPDGSGLGLYVARRLTEAHGGRIWVESEGKGKGSSFMFTLPIHPVAVDDDAT